MLPWTHIVVLLVLAFFASYVSFAPQILDDIQLAPMVQSALVRASSRKVPTPVILTFVGDIMLGRGVEARMLKEGDEYPFEHTREILQMSDITIGNFEGIIPKKHVQASSMILKFSIREEYLKKLKEVGFDILSLANNHSLDFGENALNYMRSICFRENVICAGSPHTLDGYSWYVMKAHGKKIGFIFLHETWERTDETQLREALNALSDESDMQIAFVHWGTEYDLKHSNIQAEIAQSLIDGGADAVIGHHPHVIQEIDIYNGKPIFYSLGNFIFDQYFSDDVQEGMILRIAYADSSAEFTMIPVTSLNSRNQPRPMNETDKDRLLERVLEPIRYTSGVDFENGKITLEV
jgi:poly-gamma-glutamate synthesis protein (capsule biosynthesis protein)